MLYIVIYIPLYSIIENWRWMIGFLGRPLILPWGWAMINIMGSLQLTTDLSRQEASAEPAAAGDRSCQAETEATEFTKRSMLSASSFLGHHSQQANILVISSNQM